MKDIWPGGYASGDRVLGKFGAGTVATREYCLAVGPEFIGKRVEGRGIRQGVVPVIYDTVGHFWEGPLAIRRSDSKSGAKDGGK